MPSGPHSDGAPDPAGLPVEVAGIVVDERGFSWRERPGEDGAGRGHAIPWSDVRAVRPASRLAVHVLRVEGIEDDRYRLLLSIPCPVEDSERIERAWREYVLRKVHLDGTLVGSIAPLPERGARWVLVAGLVVVFAAIAWTAATAPAEREAHAVLWYAALAATGVAVAGRVAWQYVALRRGRALGSLWERWDLSRRGIARGSGRGRLVLSPGPGDWATPRAVRLGRETVPLARLTMQPVATELVLALAERAGARVFAAWPQLTWVYAVGGVCAAGLFAGEGDWLWLAALVAAVVALSAELAASRRTFGVALSHGRDALARLGW